MANTGQEEHAKSATSQLALTREALRAGTREPAYRKIYASIRQAILAGTFPPGARLPSSRSLAQQLGLSRTTVDLAYNQLAGDGLVEGRTARGTVVIGVPAPPTEPHPKAHGGSEPPAAAPLEPGMPPLDVFPRKTWCRLAKQQVKTLLEEDMQPAHPGGQWRLREAIANRMRLVRGMNCDASQVFVVPGLGAGAMLIGKALASTGDPVLAEPADLPGAVRHALEVLGLVFRPARFSASGTALPEARLAFCSPADPGLGGRPLNIEECQRLTQWATRWNAWLVEEDRDGDLFPGGAQKAMLSPAEAGSRTLYMGTFDRSIHRGLGVGFVLVPPAAQAAMAAAAAELPLDVPVAAQKLASEFITQGHIGRYANRLRRASQERSKWLIARLRQGEFTGKLDFQAYPGYVAAQLPSMIELTALRRALNDTRLGVRLAEDAGGNGSRLIAGFPAAGRDALDAACHRLDHLLATAWAGER